MGMENFAAAIALALGPLELLIMLRATVLGMIVGALPGLGTVTALALVLPFTFVLQPAYAIGMLLAIYVSSVIGGAIPAVLINVPGTPQSAATSFEGHPMAQRGDALLALGWVTVSSAIGGLFSAASLIACAQARAGSRNKANFGKGEPEGLVASESANIDVTGGALVPTLALGIPGDAATAVMLGALIMCGVVALALAGSFVIRASSLNVWVSVVAGFVGLVLRYANVPLASIVTGFILGPTLESSLRQSMILKDGNPLRFFESPIACFFFAVTTRVVLWPLISRAWGKTRDPA